MDGSQILIVSITLIVAFAFLCLWKRRDNGYEPMRGGVALARARLGGRLAQ